jgi:hypothetical protein
MLALELLLRWGCGAVGSASRRRREGRRVNRLYNGGAVAQLGAHPGDAGKVVELTGCTTVGLWRSWERVPVTPGRS